MVSDDKFHEMSPVSHTPPPPPHERVVQVWRPGEYIGDNIWAKDLSSPPPPQKKKKKKKKKKSKSK